MQFSGIIVAAGSGSRAGGDKQWRPLGGKPVLRWSVQAMADAGADQIIVVVAADSVSRAQSLLSDLPAVRVVSGGAARAVSVQAGLAALSCDMQQPVLIHDAARPLLSSATIGRLLNSFDKHPEALGHVLALPVADSLRRSEMDDALGDPVDRDGLWRMQTPQAFRRGVIEAAYAAWPSDQTPTDETIVVRRAGGRVQIVLGDARLMKLTYPEDFAMAEALIPRTIRVGQGYDVHRWGPGQSVWLCGLEIPHDQTLIGHSDADAGLHALTDAILGSLGEGDIGDHFPPTDPQWKGAPSDLFLKHAVDLVRARGGRLSNVDVTLICERPKVKPHRQAMRERLADILDLPLHAVSVKATTTEGLGFTGRGEGLAAQAVVLIELPA